MIMNSREIRGRRESASCPKGNGADVDILQIGNQTNRNRSRQEMTRIYDGRIYQRGGGQVKLAKARPLRTVSP